MYHDVMVRLDDTVYQPLVEQMGQENLGEFLAKLAEPYSQFMATAKAPKEVDDDYRLGGLPPFHVPDDFDKIEVTDFDV